MGVAKLSFVGELSFVGVRPLSFVGHSLGSDPVFVGHSLGSDPVFCLQPLVIRWGQTLCSGVIRWGQTLFSVGSFVGVRPCFLFTASSSHGKVPLWLDLYESNFRTRFIM